ncbi:pyridoxamine 5'-phosphate oxidase [Panacagrimonas perspica]|uniref:Pyridoxine/pyridoxamine 5'-phosphate oxidase n=1 Tax=Panacagrimonas perspica TaxID=381431 RepID=A0A4S3K8Y9_9GAMM|nr:pyridoxamine 5'-phosphate oxidase [Panacagrimonas perspica]TDU24359.1 pyridoxamine 5'-phosphate oxidase [Panacagrimonas perspica]THD04747.1 pyridoxamine 5'-phosphate oxidase [Panacagrimonas perspica]
MQYTLNPPLIETSLNADPLAQFDAWLGDARAAGMIEPTAFTLATVGADGRPSARVVLFKGFHDAGLTFYTCYEGRKGQELAVHPFAAATFWWDRLERQVRFEGSVEKVSRDLSRDYFESRPRGSQIGAATSLQSRVVATRDELDERLAANVQRLEGQPVPLPDNWGGYLIRPQSVEFWQGRRNRLHDRLRYRREGDGWTVERLEP